ncbi:hypothetical protein D9M68_739230 [compost metagenome]
MTVDVEIAEYVGVEQRDTLELGQFVEVAVVELGIVLVAIGRVTEVDLAIRQRVVVPGLAAHEQAIVAPVQLDFAEQRGGRRHHVVLAEIQPAIVAVARAVGVVLTGRAIADAGRVALEHRRGGRVLGTPDGAYGNAAAGPAADFPPLEISSLGADRHRTGQGGQHQYAGAKAEAP